MILALVPPSVVAAPFPGGATPVMFAPPPRSALAASDARPLGASPPVASPEWTAAAAAPAPLTPTASAPTPRTAAPQRDDGGLTVAPAPSALPSPGGVSPMTLLRTTLAATKPLVAGSVSGAAEPAAGLWVLATPTCPLPTSADLNAWAECTQPLGFNGGELAVLEKPKAGNKAQLTGGLFSIARTHYRTAPLRAAEGAGAATLLGLPGPSVVQVEVPGLTGRSYIYVALRPEIVDPEGHFVSARAWPVPCPPPAMPDVSRRGERCVATTLKAVTAAAIAPPADGGYVLRWIDPTDSGAAGDTGGGRAYAPPLPPIYKAPRKLSPLEAAEPLPLSDLPPDLAAQQPQVLGYAPREEGDLAAAGDTSAAKRAAPAPNLRKTVRKPAGGKKR